MSRQGEVGPLRIERAHAELVGALVETRTAPYDLKSTPLSALPQFGRKLSAAARRKRKPGQPFAIWTMRKVEAWAGFHYLALFELPAAAGFLTLEEGSAVHQVRLAVAIAIGTKPGPRQLDRDAVLDRLETGTRSAKSGDDLDPLDERWVRRLARRQKAQDALGRKLVAPLPLGLLRILAPPTNSR